MKIHAVMKIHEIMRKGKQQNLKVCFLLICEIPKGSDS